MNAYNELARGIESLVKSVREEIERQIEITRHVVREDTLAALRTVALVRQSTPAQRPAKK